ncbi:hypothetical protein EPN96_03065 [bacterium]|nr:MAG: hypothetical protein EPN96_03065 [bacterium]
MSRKKYLLGAVFLSALIVWVWAPVANSSGAKPPAAENTAKNPKDPQALWVYRQSIALGVPETELLTLAEACRDQGFTTAETRRVLGLIAKAKLSGLPHEDLLAKLREGLAKKAGAEAIDEALSAKAKTLKRSKDLVDSMIMEGWNVTDYNLAIKIVADAMDAGSTPQNILSVVRGDKKRPEGMPDVKKVFHPLEPGE